MEYILSVNLLGGWGCRIDAVLCTQELKRGGPWCKLFGSAVETQDHALLTFLPCEPKATSHH